MSIKHDRDKLLQLFEDCGDCTKKLAELLGLKEGTVREYLRRAGVEFKRRTK